MIRKTLIATALVLALPVAASAQQGAGVAAGATTGAVGGALVGGPIGAVVGGVAGAVVGGISDGGPADRAGLQRGDILHALDDEVLDDVGDFYRKLWAIGPAGSVVRLKMERDSDTFDVTVRTGDRGGYHKYGSS